MSDFQTKTQRARILRLLLQSKGAEVSAYDLARIALQYGSRIHELRAMGFNIKNRTETVGRQWRRLVPPGYDASFHPRDNLCTVPQADLFGDLSKEHLDLG
jgi:hypothetical protein